MIDEDDDTPALPAAKGKRMPASRKVVVDKLWRAAKRQLAAHEAHLAELPKGSAASESDAKALATLARTVRELLALEAATASQGVKAADDSDPAAGLRRAEELRRELIRRLAGLAAEDSGEAVAPGDTGTHAGTA